MGRSVMAGLNASERHQRTRWRRARLTACAGRRRWWN